MKNILKIGFFALALGLFVASCQSSGTSDSTDQGTTVDSMATPAPATPDTASMAAPADTTHADTTAQ